MDLENQKARTKSIAATLYTQPIELGNLSKNATQIEIYSSGKPLGRISIARTGLEFRAPHQKKRGVQKDWNEVIAWLSGNAEKSN